MGRTSQKQILVVIACAMLSATAGAAEWYVAPTGTSSGDGSMARPWDLQTALKHPSSVHAGDTIWLRGGMYNGRYTSTLTGTAASPIIVRQYPHERATLSGPRSNDLQETLYVDGAYTWFWGFEVTCAGTDRVTTQTGSWPSDLDYASGVETGNDPGDGVGCKLINLIVHNTNQGLSLWQEALGFETAGCIVYHNGWDAPDRGHGHGMYLQNQTGIKLFTDNIIFGGFSYGTQAYGSGSAYVDNFTFQNNVYFDCGGLSAVSGGENLLIGGGRPSNNIVVNGNFIYRRDGNMGGGLRVGYDYVGGINQNADIRNNYFACGTKFVSYNSIIFRNNTAVGPNTLITLFLTGVADVPAYNWNFNTYYCGETGQWGQLPFWRYKANAYSTLTSWPNWRSITHYDANSSYTKGYPSAAAIFVKPNPHQSGRGNIVVFNWPQAATVNVNISPVLAAGQTYVVLDAQNYFGPPVATGTYAGGTISVPMTSTACAQPTGNAPLPYTHTPRQFGCFIVADAVEQNYVPVVSAGADQRVLSGTGGATAALAGTVSDDGLPAGAAARGTWSRQSGPGGVSFADANAMTTMASFTALGTYVLRLTVTDTVLSGYDDVTIIVAANAAPVASAGGDQTIRLPNVAALAGTVSDDGLPTSAVTVTWSCTSGPGAVTFADIHAAATTATFTTPGTYVLRLTAADGLLSGYDEDLMVVGTVTDTLMMRLPLDETTGTIAHDATPFGHNGTLMTGPTWTAGRLGGALHFDEVDDYVVLNDVQYGPEFTVSFWFKPDDNLGSLYQYVFSHGTVDTPSSLNVYLVEANEAVYGGKLRTSLRDVDDPTGTAALDFTFPVDGQWHLYAMTVTPGSSAKVYLDGALVGQEARGGGSFDPNGKLYLGARTDINSARFTGGCLDDVRINDAALSAGEIAAMFSETNAFNGDFNGDGKVNGQDFLIWQLHYPTASGATPDTGDANGDGKVNGQDFLIWQANYKPM